MVRKSAMLTMVLLALAVILTGCATMYGGTAPETPEKTYLASRIEFNNLLTRYMLYKSKETPEVKAEWTEDFDHLFVEGSLILDAWGSYIDLKDWDMSTEQETKFIEFKNTLIDLLVDSKVFK